MASEAGGGGRLIKVGAFPDIVNVVYKRSLVSTALRGFLSGSNSVEENRRRPP